MKRKRLNPHSPEVIARVVEKIEHMTPDEALAFLFYRTPGVPETDMLGVLQDHKVPVTAPSEKRTVHNS